MSSPIKTIAKVKVRSKIQAPAGSVMKVIFVNFGGADSIHDNVTGFLPKGKAEWLFTLIANHEKNASTAERSKKNFYSPTGGVAIAFDELSNATDWATEQINGLNSKAFHSVVAEGLGMSIGYDEQNGEDGYGLDEEDEFDQVEFLENNVEEIEEVLGEKFSSLFDGSGADEEQSPLLSSADVHSFAKENVHFETVATITIDQNNWQ